MTQSDHNQMRGLPNLQRTVGGVAAKIFFAHSHGGDVSGRISIPICIAAAAALLVSGLGTDLQATARANDCLTAPNASSPRGQHWYYHMDLPNNRKCWYLHAPLTHRAAKASESHAVSTTADTPVSGSRADSAPRFHGRILSVKPQPTSFVSAKSIQRGDPPWVPQENVPQGNALQVDASKPTDAVAASSPAAVKPIEQSDAPSIPQQNDPQGSTLQVDGFKPTDTVATSSPAAVKPIEQSDAPSIPQQNDPQGSTLQVDGFKPTDTVATSSPAAVKPIEQSDAPSIPQQNDQQGSTLQVDGFKPTDTVATSSPAAVKPIEQSDAPSIPQQNDPQGSTLQVDGFKPTDTVATSSPAAVKPIEQSDAPSIPQQNDPQGSTLQVDGFEPTDTVATSSPAAVKAIEQSDAPSIPKQNDGSKPTDAGVASSPATPTFTVAAAGADSARPDADAQAFDDGGRIAERSTRTTQAGIVRALSFTPVQILLLLVFGVASIVFLISLVVLMHHRVTPLIKFQLDHDRLEARAQHGWQYDRADARSSQMFVDNGRGQDGIDAPPWRVRPSATRPQNGDVTSTEPPRSSVEDVNAALEDLKAALIYEDRTQRFRQGPESPMAP